MSAEDEATLAIGELRRRLLGAVRDREQARFDLERDGEHRFAVGLVPAGEGPPGVGRFELGRGDDVLHAFLVAESAPVKAAELVVQHAGELALEDDTVLAEPREAP